jgi:suppressor for copper-sensitivity B
LPKAPDITIIEPKNPKEFKYDGKLDPINETSCRVRFTFVAEDAESVLLTADCPTCNDIFCTIVSKTVRITLPPTKSGNSFFSFLWILLLGFLGGLMLNIMPCVLPVIVMKLKSLTSREAVCGSIAGNYVIFAVFTAVTAFLKATGNIVGWGMHFQNPHFLEIMAFFLFALTLYAFDLIPLFPSLQFADKKRSVFFGNFLSSMIAAAAATPCTAPFLGTAATFAISGSVADMSMIFFAVATGFSTPYFFSFFIPVDFFSRFRRSGIILKKIINGGVLVTFLWIFWLLSNHLKPPAITIYILSFLLTATLLKMQKYRTAMLSAAICLCGLMFRDFSPETIGGDNPAFIQFKAELSKKNQIIVFNITADWCLTCKYNRRVLEDPKVVELFKTRNVKFIEADMTRKDDALMQFIGKHGRVGIPFTIVYGPRAVDGILLSETPTAEEVTNAVNAACTLN